MSADGKIVKIEEKITYSPDSDIGSGATVKQIIKYEDGKEISRDVVSIDISDREIQGEQIGLILGSQLGAVFGGNTFAGQIAASTVIGTFAQNLGEFIDKSIRYSNLQYSDLLTVGDPLSKAFEDSVRDLKGDFTANLKGQLIGHVSSLLMTELADALNLDGFEGGLFTSMGTTVTNQILNNAWGMFTNADKTGTLDTAKLFEGFADGQIFWNVAGAAAGYLGSYLASQILVADNKQASYGTSIGGAIGAYIGSFIPIPILGTFIGSFIGNLLGTALGNAFGVDEKAWGSVYIDTGMGAAISGNYGAKNEGDEETFKQIASYQAQAVTDLVTALGAKIVSLNDKGNGRIDYYQKGTTYIVTMPNGHNFDFVSRHTEDKGAAWAAVGDQGVMKLLKNAKLEGMPIFEKWVYDRSDARNAGALTTDIGVAKSYYTYLYESEKINILMKEAPKSSFAVGWALTLLRAKELGFDKIRELEHVGEKTKNDRLRGTALIDRSWGYAGNDRIDGKSKNDQLYGGSGNDALSGGADDDVLYGEADSDSLRGDAGDDTIKGGDGYDAIRGGDGNDVLLGEVGNDTLSGGDGNDSLHGGTWDDLITGGNGRDTLIGGSGYDVLRGGAGNDLLNGDSQSDLLEGGEGDDTLKGGSELDELYGGGGNDLLDGETGDDLLRGESGDDTLDGGAGSDELNGGDGDDTLKGGTGNDWMAGGSGRDVLIGGLGRDILLGGSGDDILRGDEEGDTLEGGAGQDSLEGGGGDDRLRGDADDDVLYGQAGRDDLDGGEGNDALYGGDGEDALIGSGGNDTLKGGDGDDGLVGDTGDDCLYGEDGGDILKGGAGTDILDGGAGADFLYGGSDADTLKGAQGHDELYGDLGNDSLDGGAGSDKIWGGDGADMLDGADGDDVLNGDADDDTLRGGLGDDMLSGGAGNDSLDGGSGNDQIFGGEGNDILVGGPEVDYIDGGKGSDTLELTGNRADYMIRFNSAIGRFSIVDLRAGSPDGTDLADIEFFRFNDGLLSQADLNYVIAAEANLAWDLKNSDGSKTILGWRPWATDPSKMETFIQRRNLAGATISETSFLPDGSRLAKAIDVDDTEEWDSYEQTFDAQANLIKQQYENDDTSRTIMEWDPYDQQDWDARTTKLHKVGSLYLEYWQLDVLDEPVNGSDPSIVDYIERHWDKLGAATWDTITREYDVHVVDHWLTEEIKFDNGSRIYKGRDYKADGFNHGSNRLPKEWISFEEKYDINNNKYEETYTYYATQNEGQHTIISAWDHAGQDWSSRIRYVNAVGKSVWEELYYDTNPSYSKTRWDWQFRANDWSERTTHFAKANIALPVWQQDTWRNDNGAPVQGVLRLWDYTSPVTWKEYQGFYKYNSSGTADRPYQETYLYDNNQYAVVDNDVYAQQTYASKITLYTNSSQTLTLRKEVLYDKAQSDGTILRVEKWDRYKQYGDWDKRDTKYKKDPKSPNKYLPIEQTIILREGKKPGSRRSGITPPR